MNISGTIPRLEFEVIMIFINMLLLTRGQFFVYLHEYERALYADVHLQYQALMYKHCAGAKVAYLHPSILHATKNPNMPYMIDRL